MSQIFTYGFLLLQMHGFTCGIGDLLLVPKAEKERRHKLRKADKLGDSVHAKFIGDPETQAGCAIFLQCLNFLAVLTGGLLCKSFREGSHRLTSPINSLVCYSL